MAIFGEMIKDMHASPLPKVNLEYLAERLFNGLVVLPHFEYLEEVDPSTKKAVHARGYEMFLDPNFVFALSNFIKAKVNDDKNFVDAGLAFGKELGAVFAGVLRGETNERGLANLVGPAVIKKAADLMREQKLSAAQKAAAWDAVMQASEDAVMDVATKLRRIDKSSVYNTAMLRDTFGNSLGIMPWEWALDAQAMDISWKGKQGVDETITEFFKDRRNFTVIRRHKGLMEHLDSLVLREPDEDPYAYLARIATPPHSGIFAPVISPIVASILFNTRDFPKFTESFAAKTGLVNGKIEALKRQYEEFLNAVYKSSLTKLIARRILFKEDPTQINLTKFLPSPLRLTSPIVGFDIPRSSDITNALGDNAADFLNAYKGYVDRCLAEYGIEYVNDMGDGAFFAGPSAKEMIFAAYDLTERLRTPEAKKEIRDVFESELEALARGAEEEKSKAEETKNDSAVSFYGGGRTIKLEPSQSDMRDAKVRHIEEAKEKLKGASEITDEKFPGIRITIVYDSYKMPKIKHSTATGKAAYKVSRALHSEGKPENAMVEIRKLQEANCIHHEGILMLKEPIDALKRELGDESFVRTDSANALGNIYRAKTGNKDAVVYAPKGLEFKGRQIYVAYLGRADIRNYPNEEIWTVLTSNDYKKLGITVNPRNPVLPRGA